MWTILCVCSANDLFSCMESLLHCQGNHISIWHLNESAETKALVPNNMVVNLSMAQRDCRSILTANFKSFLKILLSLATKYTVKTDLWSLYIRLAQKFTNERNFHTSDALHCTGQSSRLIQIGNLSGSLFMNRTTLIVCVFFFLCAACKDNSM